MTRQELRERLSNVIAYVSEKAPLTAEMARAVDGALASAEPAWLASLQRAWKGRRFGTPYEAPSLLLAALQREALAGRSPALARTLPTCGGREPGAGRAALETLESRGDAFWAFLADARLQTNEPARSVAWLLPACAAFLPRALPFHLVELGTSAGLVLIGDYLPRETALLTEEGAPAEEPPRWRDSPYPVLSRHGLDARPLAVSDPDSLLWLKASLWPHDLDRLARLERAAGLFAALARETRGPKLHARTFEESAAWLAENLRPHPEEGLLVFNAQAADFLPDDEYARLSEGLARALQSWGDRALWLELELPRGGGREHELRAHRWKGGRFESRVLAVGDSHGRALRVRPGWELLAPDGPARLPRNTREEPPKQLQPGLYRFPGGNP